MDKKGERIKAITKKEQNVLGEKRKCIARKDKYVKKGQPA
jgi:hypothetical protein